MLGLPIEGRVVYFWDRPKHYLVSRQYHDEDDTSNDFLIKQFEAGGPE